MLDSRADFKLENFYRVAWQRSPVRLSESALLCIESRRNEFLRLSAASSNAHPRQAEQTLSAATTAFGEQLPERVVRGIVFARLATFVEGHAATTLRIATAVSELLDGGPMPRVPALGQGGAGELLALQPLFANLSRQFVLAVQERGSLINGSPCAAALIADAALAGRRRLSLALQTFALSVEALRAPLDDYDPALEMLWGDRGDAAALRALRALLAGAWGGERNQRAPVSYRIVPRVLGAVYRAVVGAEEAAGVSLAAISDNLVFLAPDAAHPDGRCIATSGYHNALATPALDALAASWADLCLLCDRHSAKLLDPRFSQLPDQLLAERQAGESDGHGSVGYIPMAASGYTETAKSAAQTTLLPGGDSGASGKDDVAAPTFLAWGKEAGAGRCVDASLAMLAVLASQAFHVTGRDAPPALREFLAFVRGHVAPVDADRILGSELSGLAAAFTARVFGTDAPIEFGYR